MGGLRHEQALDLRVRQAIWHRTSAFVVCPLVGDSERVQAKSATEELERLTADGGSWIGCFSARAVNC